MYDFCCSVEKNCTGWVFPVGLKKPAGSKEDALGLMNSSLADHDDLNSFYIYLYGDFDDHNLYHIVRMKMRMNTTRMGLN